MWDRAVSSVTFIGVLIAIWQLRLAGRQRRRDFESLFVQRYWTIVDQLSLSALMDEAPDGGLIGDADRRAVISYLRLCEDEIELWTDRWISPEAWRQWSGGISVQLRRWPFAEVWAEVCDREDSRGPDGQFVHLRKHWHAGSPSLPVMPARSRTPWMR